MQNKGDFKIVTCETNCKLLPGILCLAGDISHRRQCVLGLSVRACMIVQAYWKFMNTMSYKPLVGILTELTTWCCWGQR